MRIINLIFAIITLPIMAIAQYNMPVDPETKNIALKKIFEFDSTFTEQRIYHLTEEWFITNPSKFNRANSENNFSDVEFWMGIKKQNPVLVEQLFDNDTPLKKAEKESLKFIGRSVVKYRGTSLGCVRIIFVEYDLKIQVKANRVKFEFLNFQYTHYNQTELKKSQIYGLNDTGPCKSKGRLEELLECKHCPNELLNFFDFFKKDIKAITNDYENYLIANKVEEDW